MNLTLWKWRIARAWRYRKLTPESEYHSVELRVRENIAREQIKARRLAAADKALDEEIESLWNLPDSPPRRALLEQYLRLKGVS